MILQWWQNLSLRERSMVFVAGICGALFMFYQLVFLPVGHWHSAAHDRANIAETGYEQVILAARLHGGQAAKAGVSLNFDATTELKSALGSSATAAGLVVLTTDGDDNRVQISFAAADPEILYTWMSNVETQYGAIVEEARMSRARNNNQLVKADRLVFVRRANS